MSTTIKPTGFSRSDFGLFALKRDSGSLALRFQQDVASLGAARDAVPNPAHRRAFSAA